MTSMMRIEHWALLYNGEWLEYVGCEPSEFAKTGGGIGSIHWCIVELQPPIARIIL